MFIKQAENSMVAFERARREEVSIYSSWSGQSCALLHLSDELLLGESWETGAEAALRPGAAELQLGESLALLVGLAWNWAIEKLH